MVLNSTGFQKGLLVLPIQDEVSSQRIFRCQFFNMGTTMRLIRGAPCFPGGTIPLACDVILRLNVIRCPARPDLQPTFSSPSSLQTKISTSKVQVKLSAGKCTQHTHMTTKHLLSQDPRIKNDDRNQISVREAFKYYFAKKAYKLF